MLIFLLKFIRVRSINIQLKKVHLINYCDLKCDFSINQNKNLHSQKKKQKKEEVT